MAEEVKVTYNKMRQQISATAQKLAELDTERNEYEYVYDVESNLATISYELRRAAICFLSPA